jgi:RHS repeat-associated protein
VDGQSQATQAVTNRRDYDAFGNVTNSLGSWQGPFGYAGGFGYQEDASGLKLLGHRYYDSSTGRFLTRDPIKDGRNWYVYCDSAPVSVVDPAGLQPTDRHGRPVGHPAYGLDFGKGPVWIPMPGRIPSARPDGHPSNNGGMLGGRFGNGRSVTLLPMIKPIARNGRLEGSYLTPGDTVPSALSLPMTNTRSVSEFRIRRPIPDVELNDAAPWHGQHGHGTQYFLGEQRSVQDLLNQGYLIPTSTNLR